MTRAFVLALFTVITTVAFAQDKPKVELPNFFNLGNLFGGGQKALKPKDKPAGEELPPPLPPVANPPKADPPKPPILGGRDI